MAKKIRKISSKIKEIKSGKSVSDSDLEKEIKKASAQKEVDSFIEFVSGVPTEELSGGLSQGTAEPQARPVRVTAPREELTAETGAERVSYEGANAPRTYTTGGLEGSRQIAGRAYNPTIIPTAPPKSIDMQTTSAQLTDRQIRGARFLGEEREIGQRGAEDTEKKGEYRAAHEGG